nr:MAG TPA: portal protein [Caudoviricetes sp.]
MNFRQKIGLKIAQMFNINVLPGTVKHEDDESGLEWLGLLRGKRKEPTADVTYFTCLKMMSETLAKMPWKYYQETSKGIKKLKDTDESRLLRIRPNPYMTPTIFWNTVEVNRNHYGNAYVYIQRVFDRKKFGGKIKTTGLWILPSDCVQIVVDDAGYFTKENAIWYMYTDKYSGQQYIFKSSEILHFKTSHTMDGIAGYPVQYILKEMVDGAIEAQNFLNNLYKNGLTAKATLQYTGSLDETKIKKMREIIERFGAGSENGGKVLPIPDSMKLTPLDVKLSDSQFVELKKYSALQIAAAFGIKPNQINDYSKSSYSNSEMQQLSFYVDTMLFVLKQYEEEVNYKLPPEEDIKAGKYFQLNEKALLRTDSATQMKILTSAVNNGMETVNEARRKLDLEDKEGGDVLIVNGTYVKLTDVGAAYGRNKEPPEELPPQKDVWEEKDIEQEDPDEPEKEKPEGDEEDA